MKHNKAQSFFILQLLEKKEGRSWINLRMIKNMQNKYKFEATWSLLLLQRSGQISK